MATLSSDQLLAMISGFRNATQLRSTWEAEMRLNFDNKVNSLIAAYSALRSLMLDPISGTFQELQARLTTAVPCYKPDFAKISSISLVPEDLMRKRNSSALQQAKTDVDGIGTKMTKFDFTNLYSAINALAADKNSTTAMTQITSEYQLILDLLNNQQTIIIQTSSTTTSFYNNDQLLTDKQKYFGAVNSSILAVSSDLQQAISNCNTTINSLNILSTTQLNTSTQGLSALISAISGKCNDAVANISNYEIAYTYALKNYSTDLTTIQTFKMDQLSLFSKLNSEQIVTFSDESFQEILQLCQSYIRGDIDKVTLAQQLVDNYANYWLTLQVKYNRNDV